jgi:3-methyladenine DNA glycosylase/8-oxoguanine DNA glycosylase
VPHEAGAPKPLNIQAAASHLAAVDPALGEFIAQHVIEHGQCDLQPRRVASLFHPLSRSIIYQQLSGRAAGTIHDRFLDLFPRRRTSAKRLLAQPYDDLRAAGLSHNKVLALQDLSRRIQSRQLPSVTQLPELHDQQIIDELVQVRGIGVWTVQMFLMFWLHRADVLPVDDLGIRKGLMLLDNMPQIPTPKQVAERGLCWRPWSTLASWYLWRRTELL